MSGRASVLEIENQWIPLADGTRLAARIWLPSAVLRGEAAPVPAILEYLPYRKGDATAAADTRRHPYFAQRGYAAVRVDIRGTGDSDGLLQGEYLPQEQDDALEVLAWLADQPWCTGRVGMIGYSWGGFNGLQIAARRPPQLGAVITVASSDDRYRDDCHYMGGCLLGSDMLKWACTMLTFALQPPDPRFVGARRRRMWRRRLEHAPELARDWVSHQLRDEFWKHGSVADDYGAVECPVFVVGGWADAYTNAVPRLLEHLRVPRLGLIGPWGHTMPHEGVPGPAMAFLEEAVRWWDEWLKGMDTGIMDEPPIRIWLQDYVAPAGFYRVRPGRWLGLGSWPADSVEDEVWTLGVEGGLVADGGVRTRPGGAACPIMLSTDHSAVQSGVRLVLRGRQECGETAGVWCANGFADEMAVDQGPDDERSLCFTSGPLTETVAVIGYPEARIRLDVDRPWAAVAARLEDVAPDGKSLLVSWGLLNLTHRDGHQSAEALEVGAAYDVRVQMRVCGHRFAAGHQIRLALSPTYWPHMWPSPQTVTLGVWVSGPSVLCLPVARDTVALEIEGPVTAEDGATARAAEVEPPRDERRREIKVDRTTGRHEIHDREVHERVIATTGARYREEMDDVYSILEEQPLSAAVRCRRCTSSQAEGRRWRVQVEGEMTCDDEFFYLREEYAAFEGEVGGGEAAEGEVAEGEAAESEAAESEVAEGEVEVYRATRSHRIRRLMG